MTILRYFFIALLIFLAAAATSLIVDKWNVTDSDSRSGHDGREHSEEGEAWELMRLRDPATGRIPDGIRDAEVAFSAGIPSRESLAFRKGSSMLDYDWRRQGPFQIGGRTRGMAIDIDDENVIMAGGVSGGLWRSIDGGTSWTRTTAPSELQSVSSIVQDLRPGKRDVWYFGTGELVGASQSAPGAYFHGDGVYRSTDRGLSWTPLASTHSSVPQRFDKVFDHVWRLALDSSNQSQDEVYAALLGTITRSTNGGTTWSEVLGGNANSYTGYYTDVAVDPSGAVYATISSDGRTKGIWRSATGTGFKAITPAEFPADYKRTVIAIAPSNPNIVYFLSETPGRGLLGRNFRGDSSWTSLWRYTWLSGDGTGAGGEWVDLSANLPKIGGSFGDMFTQGSYDMLVEVSPDDPQTLVVGGTNLYLSTNGFTSPGDTRWIGGYHNIVFDSTVIVDLEYPNHHPDLHLARFSRTVPGRLFTASDGGVHRTDDYLRDSVVWTSLNNGYHTTQFYSLSIDHGTPGSRLLVGGLQDNGTWRTTSDDPTGAWRVTGTGDGSFTHVADGGRTLYVSKQLGKVYRVELDEAGNESASTRVDPLGVKDYLFINPFVVDPLDPYRMYLAGGSALWMNSDLRAIPLASTQPATANWSKVESSQLADTVRISALGVSTAVPAHLLYYGTSYGALYKVDMSGATPGTPVAVTGTAFPKNGYVNDIAVDPLDGNHLIVVFSNYEVLSLFETTDGGASWTSVGGNLEQNKTTGAGNGPSCRSAMILHRPDGDVYLVGTSTGLYSTNRLNGASTVWIREGETAIGNLVVEVIDARQSDGFVAIGTHGGGVFTTTVAKASGVAASPAMAPGLALDGCSPNPLVGHGEISFTLPASASGTPVRLGLYDMQGAEVAVLMVDRTMTPGSHRMPIDVGHYPQLTSGSYICRLQYGRAVATKRIVVLR
jgi:photosystem II stability/assembly factor-like uncharacterized protein